MCEKSITIKFQQTTFLSSYRYRVVAAYSCLSYKEVRFPFCIQIPCGTRHGSERCLRWGGVLDSISLSGFSQQHSSQSQKWLRDQMFSVSQTHSCRRIQSRHYYHRFTFEISTQCQRPYVANKRKDSSQGTAFAICRKLRMRILYCKT